MPCRIAVPAFGGTPLCQAQDRPQQLSADWFVLPKAPENQFSQVSTDLESPACELLVTPVTEKSGNNPRE